MLNTVQTFLLCSSVLLFSREAAWFFSAVILSLGIRVAYALLKRVFFAMINITTLLWGKICSSVTVLWYCLVSEVGAEQSQFFSSISGVWFLVSIPLAMVNAFLQALKCAVEGVWQAVKWMRLRYLSFESWVSPLHKHFGADGYGIGYITLECFIAMDSTSPGNKNTNFNRFGIWLQINTVKVKTFHNS